MKLVDFEAWDIIFVSALAGIEWEANTAISRDALMRHLLFHAKPGALLVFRSAYALAKLIYPTVEQDQLRGHKISAIRAPIPGRSSLVVVAR